MKNNNQENKIESASGWIENTGQYGASENKSGVLWVTIPYTTTELTQAALRHAGVCTDLGVRVLLIDVQVVPYPCAIDRPPLNREYSSCRLRRLLEESGLQGDPVVLYARDWVEGFGRALKPGTLVIIATKTRWWQTREKRLARALSAADREVMLLPIAR